MRSKKYKKEHINLLVTIDKNYLFPLTKMLQSYSDTHNEIITDVYIAHSALEENDINNLENDINDKNIHLHNIKITESWFEDTPVLERLPKESFYRLIAFEYLPKNVERCLYLDPDIYIRKSLLPLYNMDMGNSYIAGASHMYGFLNALNKARLNLNNQKRYINSGVMLMNLKQIRKDFTRDTIFECLEENIQKLIMGDQDLVNILFGTNMSLLDERIYNLDERTFNHNKRNFDLSKVEKETAIIHYNGKYKPWLDGYKGQLDCFYPPVENKGPAPIGKLKKQIKAIFNITKATTQQKIVLFGFICFLLLWIFSYFFFGKELIKIVSEPVLFREWLANFGPFDEIIFILLRAAQTVIKFMPAEPFEIASGYAWGAIPGMIYCLIGNLIGTLVILVFTKKYGQKVLEFFMPAKNMKTFNLFKNSNSIYSLLFFLYLIPGSPKDGFTYFVGLLPVKIIPFLIITGIARIPSVISSTLCGSTLADKQYWISILIFVITIVLSILGTFLYQKYIKAKES